MRELLKYLALAGLASALLAGMAVADATDDDESPPNEVEVIQPPRPVYPSVAGLLGIEGLCEVRFNLLAGGSIMEVEEVACTHPIFCTVARDSVRQARFRVIDVPGAKHPGERNNIVYPLEFKMSPGPRDWPPGAPCTSDLVS